MKALTVLTMVLVVISGCASSGGALDTALKNRDRAQADRDRDAGRKPAQVIRFLGIGEGMTVIDMIAANRLRWGLQARSMPRTLLSFCSTVMVRKKRR